MPPRHAEPHRVTRVGWLRAAVLGANDGILSTASLMVGVAAGSDSAQAVLLAGVAGLAAGALSMAAGEYVSVSSQADAETADIGREKAELAAAPAAELDELAGIYRARGLSPALAMAVARELTAHDALAAHTRDELGITEVAAARPVQAALTSAATFASGATLPLLAALLAPAGREGAAVFGTALAALALLGYIGATAGGARPGRAMLRVVFWGALAMLVTSLIGRVAGVAV